MQYRECIKETTYEAMAELKKWDELYLGVIIQHINQYIWRILDVLQEDGEDVCGISKKHPQEYYTEIKIRGASQSIGGDFEGNFLLGKKKGRTLPSWATYSEQHSSKMKTRDQRDPNRIEGSTNRR